MASTVIVKESGSPEKLLDETALFLHRAIANVPVEKQNIIERKDDACLLRLYGRQKGFVSYTNNLTYIATRPLTACACAE